MIQRYGQVFFRRDRRVLGRALGGWAVVMLVCGMSFAAEKPLQAVGDASIFGGNLSGAREQALRNAQRHAVEMGVGLLIDSRTATQNFETLRDEVYSSSQGWVKRYRILREGPQPDRKTYRVEIEAVVESALLTEKLNALKILHKKMGNKRVMTVYLPRHSKALPVNHSAVVRMNAALENALNHHGFRVFDRERAAAVRRQLREIGGRAANEDLIALSLEQQADLVIRFEGIAGGRQQPGAMFSAAHTRIQLKVYDTYTGRLIANMNGDSKQLLPARPGPYDWDRALAQAGEQAATEAIDEAIAQITAYYVRLGDQGVPFLLVIRDYDEEEKDIILDALENTPEFRQLSERVNREKYMEIEVFSAESPSRLRRRIRLAFKEHNLPLKIELARGNRMILSRTGP